MGRRRARRLVRVPARLGGRRNAAARRVRGQRGIDAHCRSLRGDRTRRARRGVRGPRPEGLGGPRHRPHGERAASTPWCTRSARSSPYRCGSARRICASLPCILGPDGPSAPLWPQMTDRRTRGLGALARDARGRERDPADLSGLSGPRASSSRRATISAPISSDAVAAGEGALSTCSARPTERKAKSSTSRPSASIAWARTPRGGARGRLARSRARSRRTAAVNRRCSTSAPSRRCPKRQFCGGETDGSPRMRCVSRRCPQFELRHGSPSRAKASTALGPT